MTLKRRIQQLEKSGNITNRQTWGELVKRWQSGEDFTQEEYKEIFPGKGIRTFEDAVQELEKGQS